MAHSAVLRFLFVGTSADAGAIADHLRDLEFDVECVAVEDAERLGRMLEAGEHDVVVADEAYEELPWRAVLDIVREHAEAFPFIVLSGTGGEENAVEAMRAGASDFILRQSPTRLAHVLQREIRDAATRRERAHLFAELRQNKERFRRTFDKAPIGIATVSPSARFTSINERFAAFVGHSRRELLGRRFSDIIHPDDVGEAEAWHAAFVEGIRSTMELDRRFVHKDGRTVWARITVTPIFGNDGKLEQVITLINDITQHRFTTERSALQTRLLDSVEQAVVACDTDGLVTYWNRYAEELYGWRAHEVRGANVLDLVAPFSIRSVFDGTMARLHAGERWAGEAVMRRRNGQTFPAWVIAAPIHDSTGAVTGAVAVSHDITEIKLAERETRAQKEKLAEAQRIAHVGSWQYNVATGAQHWSDELSRMYGVEPGTVLPLEDVYAMIDPDDRDRLRQLAGQMLEEAIPVETDYRIRLADGSIRTLHASLRVIKDMQGQAQEIIGVAQDVTDARRFEEELRRHAARQSAAANLGHLALRGAPLETLFREAAKHIGEILGVDLCEVVKADRDNRFIMVAGIGWEPGVVGSERRPKPRSLLGITMREREPLVSHDIFSDPRLTPAEPLIRHKVRGAAMVPIGTSDFTWGLIGAYSTRERTFSDSDVDFLRTIATILGQSIEHVRADVELRIRAVQQSAISDLGQLAFSTFDQNTLERACDLARNGLGVEFALVHERVDGQLVTRAGEQWSDWPRETPISFGSQSCIAAMSRVPVIVNDYPTDTRFRDAIRELVARFGVRSGISVPIHGARIFYGVLSVYSGEPRSYTEGDVHFMQSLANILAEAIERDDATRALITSEQRYRSVVEGASEIIFEVDSSGVIRSLNRAFEAISGFAREDIIGSPFQNIIPPESLREAEEMFARLMNGQARVQGEVRLRRIDGTTVVLDVNSVPKIEHGRVVSVHGFARDVTQSRRAEHERQQLTANLQLLLESTAEGIFTLDGNGRCNLVNRAAARTLGHSEDVLLGRDMHEVLHDEARHGASECPFIEVFRNGVTITVADDSFHRADGTPFPVEYSAAPLIDRNVIVGVVVTFTDITERRKLEAKLEQANRLSSLGRLAATIAHEFNNVLMGIAPFVEVIRRTTARDRIEASLGQITHSVARGKRITSEILRFTQPAEPSRAPVDAAELMRMTANEARTIVSSTIFIEVAATGAAIIDGDVNQLQQTLMNLVLNARDAMPGGGTIALHAERVQPDATFPFGRVEHPERFVHLSVRDNGSGMPPETQRHIFEPLFTTKKNGTGLGLPLAHQIVARHGGEIFVESTVGAGTTFHLFLPASAKPAVATPPPPPSPLQLAPTAYRRVLLVEDDAAVAAGIVSILEMEGLDVDIIDNGTDAIETIRGNPPDVVVLDVGLPDMEGTAVYDAISLTHPGLPVIFSTGHADASRLEVYLAKPRVSYLLKPYDAQALLEAIAEVA